MSKFGTVHSGYKKILPIGKKLCLRFMLDDYQRGDFWYRRRCDHDDWSSYVYLEKRSYTGQILSAIDEGVKELFFCIDTPGNNFQFIQEFIEEIVDYSRFHGFPGEIIISAINEPLEHVDISEIHWLNKIVSGEVKKYRKVSFAVGEMASDFYDYYRSYSKCNYSYDYISFHTDNCCHYHSFNVMASFFPKGTKFINNEHYSYDNAQLLGYDHKSVVDQFRSETVKFLNDGRIKSVYVCMPYHEKDKGRYPFLGLNKVDSKTGKVYTTLAWQMLKTLEVKESDLMKLLVLKYNDQNFQVRTLQECLLLDGFECGEVDGWFGKKTLASLEKYNVEHGVPAEKVCSFGTWLSFLDTDMSHDIVMNLIELLKVI